jgi:sortase A
MTMPTVEVDGNTYVGFLHIPAIDRTLPVMDTWSYPNLKIAPNRFVGTAYARDMIICAHNYDRHFGQIKNLQPGDKVTFTDVYGDRFDYEVSEVTILQPTDVEEMKDPDDWDLTLFTCTIGGATRVTVRCVMKGSTEGTWNTAAKADLSEKIAALQRQSETQKQT